MKNWLRATAHTNLLKDFALLVFSVLIAVLFARSSTLTTLLVSAQEYKILGSFIAGTFFTSVFTTAPAVVTLGALAQTTSPFLVAVFGAAGSVLGDMIIFYFVRDRFSEHLAALFEHQSGIKRIRVLFKRRAFKWVTFLVGGLIIASPFPDEIGISLLGFSKMKSSNFAVLSFTCNFVGILLLGFAARAFI